MKQKKEAKGQDKYLAESGALAAFKQFKEASKRTSEGMKFIVEILSNLNIEEVTKLIDLTKSEKQFGRSWQEIGRAQAYDWMSDAYRAVDTLGLYANQLTSLAVALNGMHSHAQNTVELTEKAFADACVTIGMDVA